MAALETLRFSVFSFCVSEKRKKSHEAEARIIIRLENVSRIRIVTGT